MFHFQVCLYPALALSSDRLNSSTNHVDIRSFNLVNNLDHGFLIRFIRLQDGNFKIELYESDTSEDHVCQLYQSVCFDKLFEDSKREHGENVSLNLSITMNSTSISF